tara:strand:+ start:2367 stop:2594 length:228 start_codon:yes stop_codon:yes gene_type:complete
MNIKFVHSYEVCEDLIDGAADYGLTKQELKEFLELEQITENESTDMDFMEDRVITWVELLGRNPPAPKVFESVIL